MPSHSSYIESLSYLIANNPDVKIMYMVWIIVYFFFNLFILYIILGNDLGVIDNSTDVVSSTKSHCNSYIKHRFYITATILYIPATFLKLFGLLLLWIYDFDIHSNEHYVWTAIALISAVICSVCLCIRRYSCRHYIYIHKWVELMLSTNTLLVLGQLGVLISIALVPGETLGLLELILSVLLFVDLIYQIFDVYNDYLCYSTMYYHVVVSSDNHIAKNDNESMEPYTLFDTFILEPDKRNSFITKQR